MVGADQSHSFKTALGVRGVAAHIARDAGGPCVDNAAAGQGRKATGMSHIHRQGAAAGFNLTLQGQDKGGKNEDDDGTFHGLFPKLSCGD
jgi:hypothetical protein